MMTRQSSNARNLAQAQGRFSFWAISVTASRNRVTTVKMINRTIVQPPCQIDDP